MTIELKNARIKSTSLGYEDHGCITAYLHLEYKGSSQGFGGHVLSGEYTHAFIKGVLDAVKVEKWEDLPGKNVRVKSEHTYAHEIGHIIDDSWFNIKKTFAEIETSEKK